MLFSQGYASVLLAFYISGQLWGRWRKAQREKGEFRDSHGGPLALPLGFQEVWMLPKSELQALALILVFLVLDAVQGQRHTLGSPLPLPFRSPAEQADL